MKKILKAIAAVVVCVVVYGFVTGAVLIFDASTHTQPKAVTDIQVAKEFFGFESGKEYGLNIGQQVSNLELNASGDRYYFSISAATNQEVTVTFMNGNEAYMIRLPLEGINRAQIFIDDAKPATMKIDMRLNSTDSWGREEGLDTSAGVEYPAIESSCHYVFRGLLWRCEQDSYISSDLSDPRGARAQGLQGMIERDLQGATLIMPQGMYDQLVGRINNPTPATPGN